MKNHELENLSNPLSQDFTFISLLKFAFPTIVTMLFMGIYTIVDTIFVSQFVNENALSALNIVCPVINVIVGLATMLATGGNAIIAKKMGKGQTYRANQDFTLIVFFGVTIGLIITGLGLLFLNQIIKVLGASSLLLPYCRDYLYIILIFAPASIMQVIFQNMIVTAGRPTFSLILSFGAGMINMGLDYMFIVFMNMGIVGAALGTGIGYLFSSVIGLLFFYYNKSLLTFVKPVIDISIIVQSCANGSSEMVSQLATALTTFFSNVTMMRLVGEEGVAAITILIYIQFFMTTLYIGFSMGIAPLMSYNFGAKNKQRLQAIFQNSLLFIIISSIIIFLIVMMGKNWLIQLFVNQSSKVYMMTIEGFNIFAFSFLFSGLNIFSSAIFTALSNGKISAFISFLRTFGLIMPGLIVLPQFMQTTGVWMAIPIAEILTFCMTIFCIICYRKRYGYLSW